MNNILILSDSYTEHMASLAFPFYNYLLDERISGISLLAENHTVEEARLLNSLFPVTLEDNLCNTYSKCALLFGDNAFFDKVAGHVHADTCILYPNPWQYAPTDLVLTQSELQLFSNIPVILILTFSNCSSIVNTELSISNAFEKKKIPIKRLFLPGTYDFLYSMHNDISQEAVDEFEPLDNPKVVVKSIYWDQELLISHRRSEIISFIEKIHPDYTILCLDGDSSGNQLQLDMFDHLFGKTPDAIVASAYYNYCIGGQQIINVFSAERCNNSMYGKNNLLKEQLFREIISKITLPNNVHIL